MFASIDRDQTRIGHIREILLSTDSDVKFVVLQLFSLAPALHPKIHAPCLDMTDEEVIVSGQVHSILTMFS